MSDTAPPRTRLIDSALALFQRGGFHATGIDRLLAEAGVAKMTLYKHFGSKDELVIAVLRNKHAAFMGLVEAEIAAARDAKGRLLAVFEVLGRWCGGPEFAGCLFTNAAAEYGAASDPVHRAAAASKRAVFDLLARESTAAGVVDPPALAGELMLLHEGAIAATFVMGDPAAVGRARQLAERLVTAALEPPTG